MNEVLQWILVGIFVIAAVLYFVKRFARSSKGKCDGCSGCRAGQDEGGCDKCGLV